MASKAAEDRFTATMQQHGGTVLETSLSAEDERERAERLTGPQPQWHGHAHTASAMPRVRLSSGLLAPVTRKASASTTGSATRSSNCSNPAPPPS